MTAITFDTLAYSKTLQDARMPVEQADALARVQKAAIEDMLSTKEWATKADLRETELRLQAEIEKVRAEVQQNKYDLLKWQIAGWVALAAIMAKGFGWLGFI